MVNRYLITFLALTVFTVSLQASVLKEPKAIQAVIDKIKDENHIIGIEIGLFDTQSKSTMQFVTGLNNRQTKAPLKKDNLMQIGSTTKSFISALILMLEEEAKKGKLNKPFSIEQTVGEWLPELSDWQDIKIKSLLNMTSGIMNYIDNPVLLKDLAAYPNRIWTPVELIHLAYTSKPNRHFKEGSNYEYSNTNYVLAGLIIERVTGKSLEEVIEEKLFMAYPDYFKHTYYTPLKYPKTLSKKMAHGYMLKKDNKPLYQHDTTAMTLSWASSAGGIVSNAKDLAMWPALLFSDNLLSSKERVHLKERVCVDKHCKKGTSLPIDSHLQGYGLGVGYIYDKRYGDIWTHNGSTLGYHTAFLYMPKHHLSMAVMINEVGPKIHDMEDVLYIARQVLKP